MDILLLPFKLIASLLGFVLGLVGAIVLFAIGLVFVLVGGVLMATGIGSPVGVGLIVVGLLLVVKAIF